MVDINALSGAGAAALRRPIPTAHDRSFVAYPIGLDPQFEKCLPDIEIQEGPIGWSSGPMPFKDFSNDAHDPGGKTGEGITQREYDLDRRQWGLPMRDIRRMSKDEERTIYYVRYWLPWCPKLPVIGLKLEFFNMAVNGGPGRATRLLQRVLGISVDGDWGPVTEEAVLTLGAAGFPADKVDAYRAQCDAFYRALPGYRWFGVDWIRRDREITAAANAMDRALDEFTRDAPAPIMKDAT